MTKNLKVSLKNITKTFGDFYANKDVNLDIYDHEILAILGENGSGKTTLLNMLSGIYYPDGGEILIDDKPVTITNPKEALKYGIGMVHQHFKLIDVFSTIENIAIGLNGKLDLNKTSKEVVELANKYGFTIDPKKKIFKLSVSEKQTVEIMKVLYYGAEVLILDEPTAVLTPQESEKLFNVLRNMRDDGKAIIIITHKLNEVLELSDRVAIMRKGEMIEVLDTDKCNEAILTEAMVGKKVELKIDRIDCRRDEKRLDVKKLSYRNHQNVKVLHHISFDVYSGEILGVAGISGNGQMQLLECIAGLRKRQKGEVLYTNPETHEVENLCLKTPLEIRELGVHLSYVPEDRLGMGLIGNMDITDNIMLRYYNNGKSPFLNRQGSKKIAKELIDSLEISYPNENSTVKNLSGGNLQKVLVGREIASNPNLLMVAYPVRGLDINSSYIIYDLLNQQKQKGTAIIFVGEDLDVLLQLCDRIAVINDGRIVDIVDAKTTTKEQIGLLMTKDSKKGA